MATNPLGRTRKPKKRTSVIVAELIAGWLTMFYGAWMLMLGVGVAHHEWLPSLPTIGWWPSLLLMFILSGVVNATRRINLDD